MSHQTIILMNLFDLQTNPDLKKFQFIIDQSGSLYFKLSDWSDKFQPYNFYLISILI